MIYNRLTVLLLSVAMSTLIAIGLVGSVGAINVVKQNCGSVKNSSAVCKGTDDNVKNLVGSIISTLLFLIGGVAVLMMVLGGFRYVTSNGDPKQLEAAKNTILYAVIGIIVALAASAIVAFVVDRLA